MDTQLQAIDDALSRLEPAFALEGYELIRSSDESFDVPHRNLRRVSEIPGRRVIHGVQLRIAVGIAERLEHGFHDGLPISISADGQLQFDEPFRELSEFQVLVERFPYHEALTRIPDLMQRALHLHDRWDAQYLSEHGRTVEEIIAA